MDEGKDWVIVRQEVLRPAVFMSHVKETVFTLLRVLSKIEKFWIQGCNDQIFIF